MNFSKTSLLFVEKKNTCTCLHEFGWSRQRKELIKVEEKIPVKLERKILLISETSFTSTINKLLILCAFPFLLLGQLLIFQPILCSLVTIFLITSPSSSYLALHIEDMDCKITITLIILSHYTQNVTQGCLH